MRCCCPAKMPRRTAGRGRASVSSCCIDRLGERALNPRSRRAEARTKTGRMREIKELQTTRRGAPESGHPIECCYAIRRKSIVLVAGDVVEDVERLAAGELVGRVVDLVTTAAVRRGDGEGRRGHNPGVSRRVVVGVADGGGGEVTLRAVLLGGQHADVGSRRAGIGGDRREAALVLAEAAGLEVGATVGRRRDLGATGDLTVAVAVTGLRLEADGAEVVQVAVLLTEVRLLRGVEGLQVGLRLALLGAGLEAHEVGDGD